MLYLNKTPMFRHRGFTLIELVAVLVLLGIISVFASSRFSSRSDFAGLALRDEFVSSYRYVQQRAMYDHTPGVCYSLSISAGGFEPHQNGAFFGDFGQVLFVGDYSGFSVSPTVTLYFDGLGAVYSIDCGNTPVGSPLTLTVGYGNVEIYPTGYIRVI